MSLRGRLREHWGAIDARPRLSLGSRAPLPHDIDGAALLATPARNCYLLVVGPGALDLLPLDVAALEAGVYHALAVVFIALGLQRPPAHAGRGATSMAFGVSTIITLRTAVGLGIALASGVHAGFGWLLPLGFEQGPGQALLVGGAWEASGMPHGAQVGLIVAAIGFGWAMFAGVPLVVLGRRWTWASGPPSAPEERAAQVVEGSVSTQLGWIALVYAATWGGLFAPGGSARVGAGHRGHRGGGVTSWWVRSSPTPPGGAGACGLGRWSPRPPAVAGLRQRGRRGHDRGAVRGAARRPGAFWVPILAVTLTGGLVTLIACVWLARRGFADAPFEQAVLWFGMSTGTLPVGLALLRMIDPEMRSPAPSSAVYGSGLAINRREAQERARAG